MRKEVYRMPEAEAWALLDRAPVVHLATTAEDGRPILRTVHGVVVEGMLAFHGAPAGEKMEGLGRPAVVAAEEILAEIPSWFVDPERACPATTYYRSVQLHGVVEPIEDHETKAAVLAALMRKFQPEGGHRPIEPGHFEYDRLYRKAVDGLLVAGIRPDRVDGKGKLGQNRRPAELARIVECLWQRGRAGDLAALEAVLAANPEVSRPAFLTGPHGLVLAVAPSDADVGPVVDLLETEYWCVGVPRATLEGAVRGAPVRVVARDGDRVVASASAMSDGHRRGWIMDVVVHPAWRGRGVGQALMRLLLDHPALRHCQKIGLSTRDAQSLYRRFGFSPRPDGPEVLWRGEVRIRRENTGPQPGVVAR